MSKSKPSKTDAKQVELVERIAPLEYDPLDPSFSALHRAGIAGLLLQIIATEKLREQVADDSKAIFRQVDWSYIEDGRGIKINFDIETFRSLLRERYLGIPKSNGENEETQSTSETDKSNKKKQNVEPGLSYLEALGASEKFRLTVREGYRKSFFQIYQERIGFFQHTKRDESNTYLQEKIDRLWIALAIDEGDVEIQRCSRPNISGNDFKSEQLREKAKKALLLHFWPLVSGFFKPVGFKKPGKDKKTKQLIIEYEYQLAPAIVVPDVVNVRTFVRETVNTYNKESNNLISVPLEAPLAFFLAPRLAHNQEITSHSFGARGATVFSYKYPLKNGKPNFNTQPIVAEVFDAALDDSLLVQYKRLLRIKSYPYKAMRVANLLAGRAWHYGFDDLVDKFPLELFVPTKQENGSCILHPKAHEMALDLADDFYYFANKENKMNDEETNVPALINEIILRYLRWRVYNRGQNPPNENDIRLIFEKRRNGQDLTQKEEDLLANYNDLYSKGVSKEFIDARGATDPRSFAELFIGRFFEA
ncbi:MAG: hypothetical protein ABR566_17775, partial [Pyrinomonadaceae bacterium]